MAEESEENTVEETPEDENAGESEGGEARQDVKKSRPRLSPKKLGILALPLVLLLGAGGYFASGFLPSFGSAPDRPDQKLYYNLPEMVVNLSSRDKRAQYLKLKVSLEAPNQKTLDALVPIMPRVLDMFQLYLRELRSSDLEGSAGIYRLKEELLRRINLEIHPQRVSRVLFNEIIVQ